MEIKDDDESFFSVRYFWLARCWREQHVVWGNTQSKKLFEIMSLNGFSSFSFSLNNSAKAIRHYDNSRKNHSIHWISKSMAHFLSYRDHLRVKTPHLTDVWSLVSHFPNRGVFFPLNHRKLSGFLNGRLLSAVFSSWLSKYYLFRVVAPIANMSIANTTLSLWLSNWKKEGK